MAQTPTPEAQPPNPPLPEVQAPAPPAKAVVPPEPGEVITSLATGNTYTMGEQIGEGSFGVVFSCVDIWGNNLAAKVLKPIAPYEKVRASAEAELEKLLALRHPNITYVFDAFEFRDTFYIITERCYCPLTQLLDREEFKGPEWLMPIARCLLQAVHYIHLNQYVHQDIHPGNVFAAFAKDEMRPTSPGAIQFKVGDLGVAKLFGDVNPTNTRAQWMLPPEAFEPAEFGPLDYRIDIYHVGLLLLQLANSRELQFSKEEILAGRPREMAIALSPPYSFALEKALRRHVAYRTASAMELWRDLHTPEQAALPAVAGEPGEPGAAEQADAADERAPASEPPARS
jgi:serine/threonine protein kinase